MPRRLHRGRAPRGPDRRGAGRPAGAARQQQVRPRSWPPPWRSGVGRIVVDSFDEIDRLERLVADPAAGGRRRRAVGPAPEGAGPDHPGRGGPHPRVRPHRPGGLQVRLRPGLGRRRRRRRAARRPRRRRRRRVRRASTPTSAARSSRSTPSPRPSTCWPSSSPRSVCPNWWSGAGSGVAYVNGEEAPPMAQWAGSVREACRRAGIARLGPGHGRARAGRSWPPPGSPCTGWGPSRTCPVTGPTCRWTAG